MEYLIGLVSKVEKNLSDHTEFLSYKNEMDKWLANANETLDDCGGIGDAQQTQQKLDAVNVSVPTYIFLMCFYFCNFYVKRDSNFGLVFGFQKLFNIIYRIYEC